MWHCINFLAALLEGVCLQGHFGVGTKKTPCHSHLSKQEGLLGTKSGHLGLKKEDPEGVFLGLFPTVAPATHRTLSLLVHY